MSLAEKEFYRFGEFTVDGVQKVLLHKSKPVALAPKVFDTLLILVGSSGKIVEKEELMNRLWPDTFVEESNLTFNIKQLRKALGDSARQPRFVETVARRGYRFIANLDEPIENIETTLTPEVARPRFSRIYLFVPIAVLLVASVILALWLTGHRYTASAMSAPLLSTPFRSEKFATGGIIRTVITPDGRYVAYTTETGGKQSLWLRQLDSSENIQIVPPSDHQYIGLAVSHDGKALYFVRKPLKNPPISALYRVMTFGGIPVKLVDWLEGTVSLSPDDKHIVFIRCKYEDHDNCSLLLADDDGKNERKLLTRERPIRLSSTQFSPDGKSIAFASGESLNGGSDFHLMSFELASGAERQITSKSFFDISSLKWLSDGKFLLLTAKENHDGRLKIYYVSAITGEIRPITRDATDYIDFSLDRAADKMIATQLINTFHLYVGKINDVSHPRSVALARCGVTFDPSGRIFYEGNDGDLWTVNVDGGEQRQLTNNASSDIYPLASPDSRYIFFASNRSGSVQVWRMNADSTNQIQITKTEGGFPVFVTSDGRWVYFRSSLHQTLWRVLTEGGQETQVSAGETWDPAISRDAKYVAYFLRDANDHRLRIGVMTADTQTRIKTFPLADDTFAEGQIAWLSDNRSFYYLTMNGSQSMLWYQSLDSNLPSKQIATLGNDEVTSFVLAPDDNTFSFIRGRWIYEAVLIEGLK